MAEPGPDTVATNGLTLEQRMAAKDKLDERLQQIQNGADNIKKIIDTFRTIQGKGQQDRAYTPIDFILDLNSQISSKIPEQLAAGAPQGSFVSFATVRLPISSLSDDCKNVDAKMESTLPSDVSQGDPVSGSSFHYFLRTCTSNGVFLPVFDAVWTGDSIALNFNNQNLSQMFQSLLKLQLSSNMACSVLSSDNNIIASITCQDLQVDVSSTETAVIRNLSFSNSDDVRFSAKADIYDKVTAVKKAVSDISVSSDGHVNATLDRAVTGDVADTTSQTTSGQ